MKSSLSPTSVFDSYWRFAVERLNIYFRKIANPSGPWTSDPILQEYRFTNTFRAADRVSQYLIRQIQYHPNRSSAPDEVFFRTILFKLFNRISTWEALEGSLGPLSWQSVDFEAISRVLESHLQRGNRIYSAAYIMPSPGFGHNRKHANHLAMLAKMMGDGLPRRLSKAKSLQSAYELILEYPGIGPFLAFQYAIDLNYSTLLNFDEADFVVAGPGALDGISKCFADARSYDPATIIHDMVNRQDEEFRRLGLQFQGLFGRPLQPIDCQNLFCEISKYARVAHPDVAGASGRTRIKQRYHAMRQSGSSPYFPPKWHLDPVVSVAARIAPASGTQLSLL